MDLAFLAHSIVTDEQFAEEFQNHPEGILRNNGVTLDAESLQALIRLVQNRESMNALLKDPENIMNDPLDWAIITIHVTDSNECAP